VARLETGIAGLRVVTLAGTGHMVQLDAPEALASVIASFFADSSVL
jgi:pimeloyl-ACP methyl ester carboxylesterase